MNVYKHIKEIIEISFQYLADSERLPPGLDAANVTVEPPRDPSHGDLATNAAMVLAKQAQMDPRELGGLLADTLAQHDDIDTAEVAGPGFVNLRLSVDFWKARIGEILTAGRDYGTSEMGAGRKVNVEYVSANPTGPMHVGHGRGAVVGDALAGLLAKAGFDVTREYYINDAGAQVDTLARSLHVRYREALGEDIGAIPEGLYPGDYLVPVGQAVAAEDGDKWRDAPEADWLEPFRVRAIDAMMALIREDLKALGVVHDVFTSERALVAAGAIDDVVSDLEERDLVYTGTLEPPKGKPPPDDWEERPQLLFRATEFGDDVDRPLRKAEGDWTYFASDIGYHLNKFRRGFATMVDVWGADHKGYVKRMQAAVKAVSQGEAALDVRLCSLVNLSEGGEPVKMSKRAGTFVTLRDVIDEVGKDVVRFIMLTRNNEALLDFDLQKVTEQSRDNPVFYVQYAHARTHSVMRMAAEAMPGIDLSAAALRRADFARLTDEFELALIRTMGNWPRTVESAAEAHEPHRLAFYLYDLASEFHTLWTKGKEDVSLRFIVENDPALTAARLALALGVRTVIAAGLGIFGVKPVEELR